VSGAAILSNGGSCRVAHTKDAFAVGHLRERSMQRLLLLVALVAGHAAASLPVALATKTTPRPSSTWYGPLHPVAPVNATDFGSTVANGKHLDAADATRARDAHAPPPPGFS